MKKVGLIKLICSLIVVISVAIAVTATVVIGKAIAQDKDVGAELEKRTLVIASSSATTTYNGKTLTNGAWEILEGELKSGHKIFATVNGAQTSVGISENHISVVIKDKNGFDVTDQYDIHYNPGALNVRPRTVTVSAESLWKTYDGNPLVADGFVLESPLLKGDRVVASVEGEITEPGNVESVITELVILNEKDEDVTHNYNVKTNTGKLVVSEPDAIVINSFGASKQYDGFPLICDEWELVSGEILEGHELIVEGFGELTDVGSVPNEFNAYIVDAFGNDVSVNYKIDKTYENLTVNQRVITKIASEDDSKVYDGTPLTNSNFTVEFEEPMDNSDIVIDVRVIGSITDVGEAPNTIDSNVRAYNGSRDITDFFVVELGAFQPGTLTVYPEDLELIDIEFKAGNAQKIYDGLPLTNNTWEIVSGELLSGHTAYVTINGYITDAGETVNEISSIVIRSAEGTNVTFRYNILAYNGVLSVVPLSVKLQSGDAEKMYDGTPLTCSDHTVELAYDELPEGLDENVLDRFNFSVNITGTITNPGEVSNTIRSCSVSSAGTGDPINPDNFEFIKEEGTLTVTEDPNNTVPTLEYRSDSSRKTYDGTPLTNSVYRRVSGELLDGHTEVVEMVASITDVGSIDNTMTISIVDIDGTDVTDQYIIINVPGTLQVTRKEITVTANSARKQYDATPLTEAGFVIEPMLAAGEEAQVVTAGSQTNVGTSSNTISSFVIVNSEGTPVTDNYNVSFYNGTLEVYKRNLTITVVDKSKDYDGTPLLSDENPTSPDSYTVTPDGALLDGHVLTLELTGSQTDPGISENRVSSYQITDASDEDVTENYNVTVRNGKLTVNEIGGGGEDDDSGEGTVPIGEGGIAIGGASTSNKIVFEVTNKKTTNLYLKMGSYGDYTGKGWQAATVYNQSLSNGEKLFFITAHILAENGFESTQCIVKPKTDIYVLPYYVRGGSITSGSNDAVINGSLQSGYIGNSSGFYYYDWTWNKNQILYMPENIENYELAYRQFVRDNYLELDDDVRTYLLEFIAENGLSASNPAGVAACVRNIAKYNLEYDQSLNEKPDIVKAFLTGEYEGICQHFASAATLIYRALGIPARYTTGFAVPTVANSKVDVRAKMAHAWVEIYIDGLGWVNMEVTGTGSAALGEDRFEIKVKPVNTEGVFVEGEALEAKQQVSVTGLPQGYAYEFVVSGTNYGLGKTQSSVSTFIIKDNFGNTVYDLSSGLGSETFILTYETGTVHRYLSALTFSSESVNVEREYNGLAEEFTAELILGTLGDGYTYVITPTEIINAGSVSATFSVKILKDGVDTDADGNPYTDHYKVSEKFGHITINKKIIDLTAASKTQEYSGEALVCNELEPIADGVLVSGDSIDLGALVIEGSQLNIGSSSNVIRKVVIKNERGRDVTANYQINMHDGLLTVTRPTATGG